MRTDDLIDALARDVRTPDRSVGRSLAIGCAVGAVLATGIFLWLLGPRADFTWAITTPWYPLKIAILAVTAACTVPVVAALARPGASVPRGWLLLPLALLAIAVLADLATLGVPGAAARLVGHNSRDCVTLIPILAAAPLAAILVALRRGASTSPVRSSLAAGLLSAAIGGVLYGLYCPDDSPLFVAVWYALAFAIVALVGMLAGRVLLRW